MNILYINHYAGAPPYGMEFRPYYMAKEWRKFGHKVLIVAASYSHLRFRQPEYQKKSCEAIDGVDYQWYKTPQYSSNGILRVKNIFSFLYRLYRDTARLVKEFAPDVVIASSTYPFDIWPARHIAKKAKAKLVYEIHDLWPLSPIELGGMSPKHPFIRLCQKAENDCYQYSDAVVSILPNVHEHVMAHGLDIKKLYIVPNGIVEEEWNETNSEELSDNSIVSFFKTQKDSGNIIVGYAGAHGKPNALEYLLEAAKLLIDKPVVFALFGNGLEKNNLIQRSKELNIKNVFFFNAVNKRQMFSLLKNIDIAYISLRSQPLFRFGVSPNKLMDYMVSGTPIISAIRSANDLVTEVGCGITVAPADPTAIANGFIRLMNLTPEERRNMGKHGREYILKNQTYPILAKKFLDAVY
jgi:putative glycosyltransferase